MAHAIVMGDGELDRLDPGEIGFVQYMFAARARAGFLPQYVGERVGHAVERGDMRQAERAAAGFQPPPQHVVGQGEEHEAGIGGDVLHDPVEMDFRSHHGPEMADRLDILEQADRRLGDILQRFAGGVGQEMKVNARHVPFCVEGLWIKQGRNPWMKSAAFPLPTGGTLIHRPPTGPQIPPQPVDNGDSRTDSGGIACLAGVNLLANRGTAHKPRCQRTSICIILFES